LNPKCTALCRETPECGIRSVGSVQVSPVFVFYLLLFRLKQYRIHSVTKNTSRLSISILQLETSNFPVSPMGGAKFHTTIDDSTARWLESCYIVVWMIYDTIKNKYSFSE
jgi:hypothetical protein